MSAVLIKKCEEVTNFGGHDKRFSFNDYLFCKVWWASRPCLAGKSFTRYVSSLSVHHRNFAQMQTQELLFGAAACTGGDNRNNSPVEWSALVTSAGPWLG